jgi:hypothetical protein
MDFERGEGEKKGGGSPRLGRVNAGEMIEEREGEG